MNRFYYKGPDASFVLYPPVPDIRHHTPDITGSNVHRVRGTQDTTAP